MKIPFYKPSLGEEEINEVVDTLRSGWLTTGPRTKRFEKEFAEYLRHQHAVAVNSCTAALHLALEAIGLKAGQGVIVPTMTFAATAEVVRYFGARPILVDCRAEDFNLDVADAERKIKSALADGQSVAAIMPMHYGGQIGDVAGVRSLANRYQLKVVEDAAHCCPAYYRNEKSEIGNQKSAMGREVAVGSETRPSPEQATPHPTLSPTGAERANHPASDLRFDPGKSGATLAHLPRRCASTAGQMGEGQGVRASGELSPSSPPLQLSAFSFQDLSPDGWQPVGTGADISCYSFYANKTITTGEGGMACTNNEEYADRMRIMSLHGISKDAWKRYTGEGSWYYEIIAPGFKYNLTDIAAAIGIHQLRKADEFHRRRTELALQYNARLAGVDEVVPPMVQPNRIHSWHLYVIRLKLERLSIDRARFIQELLLRGIGTSVHWLPLHMHPYYRETYGYVPPDLPTAASLYPEIITLPIYPGMSDGDVSYVCDSIKDIVAHNLRAVAAA